MSGMRPADNYVLDGYHDMRCRFWLQNFRYGLTEVRLICRKLGERVGLKKSELLDQTYCARCSQDR